MLSPIRWGPAVVTLIEPMSGELYGTTCCMGTPYIQFENQFQSDLPSRATSSV